MLRYGVIGTGMMGIEHMMNIAHIDGAEVTAYADTHEASRIAAATIAPDAIGFADHRELLGSGLCDAVVVATPNHTHVDVLADVLATELHTLVEKPLATTVEDCRRIEAWAGARSAVTWVAMEYRYMPPVHRLIEEVRAGTVGRAQMFSIREHRFPFLPKVDDWNRFSANTGGTLVEKCCHYFDLMNHVLDDRPTRVVASGGQAFNHLDEVYDGRVPDIIDHAYAIVEYERGARALLDLSMFAEATHDQEELVVVGDLGKVEALVTSNVVRIGRRGTHFIGSVETHEIHDDRITFEGHHHGSSQLEHLEFIRACATGEAPAVSVHDGLLAVAIGVAAHRSIDESRWVELDEVLAP